MPRSLHACMGEMYDILKGLSDAGTREPTSGRRDPCAVALRPHRADLCHRAARDLMAFLDKTSQLAQEITDHFLVPVQR
jgi:uncharacterized alpha-E superfamily protein